MNDFIEKLEDRLEDALAKLRTERDELRVQLHLLKAEARDEWDAVEKKWTQLEQKYDRIYEETRDASGDVGEAFHQLADEIRQAYRRVRQSMS